MSLGELSWLLWCPATCRSGVRRWRFTWLLSTDRRGGGTQTPCRGSPSLPPSLGIDSCSGPWHLVSATIFVAVRTGCGWARGGAAACRRSRGGRGWGRRCGRGNRVAAPARGGRERDGCRRGEEEDEVAVQVRRGWAGVLASSKGGDRRRSRPRRRRPAQPWRTRRPSWERKTGRNTAIWLIWCIISGPWCAATRWLARGRERVKRGERLKSERLLTKGNVRDIWFCD
jgi:hypothetical protein